MMTLGLLRNDVARETQVPLDSSYATINIRNYINKTYQRIWDSDNWYETIAPVTLSLAANTSIIVLDKQYEKVLRLMSTSQLTEYRNISPQAFYDLFYSTQPASTLPSVLAPLGFRGVQTQPVTAAALKVKSSSASDGSSVKVFVRGINASGEEIDEVVALNGTTAVATANTYTTVTIISKQVYTVGRVTLYDYNGTTELAAIGIRELSPRWTVYKFNGTPTEALSLPALAKLRFVPLVNSADTPLFDCDAALINGATGLSWREQRQPELAVMWETAFADALDDLKKKLKSSSGTVETFFPMGRF